MKPSELRKLLDAASSGEWCLEDGNSPHPDWMADVASEYPQDANLIATSRNILPLLLQLWEAAKKWERDPDGEVAWHNALAALDQYGEGET